ncbi:hypothetical protein [Pseudoxanthomonas sp. SE1]|uniref:hypothetical protein n=1 Tax=Pseudoxanthomonas sp. SE1 TaxID=1664560 RepID=UPI00240DBE3A|nr:hypothetical protein [Pseudoxanthomonas sp. SE1]WFC43262.1 hypothetical protein OY559_07050 [Pseudoxanthomonas sp. SE1]
MSRLSHAGWLMRYWVMDKYHDQLRWYVFFIACSISVAIGAVLVHTATRYASSDAYGDTVRADGGATIIIQIIIFVVSLAISYAMRPKVEQAKPQEGKVPDVEDGTAYDRIYGEVWVDDSFILGWKNLGTEAIKSKGSKKWKPGLLPGTTNPIESWLDDEWNLSGLNDVDDPLGGGNHYPDEGEFDPDSP